MDPNVVVAGIALGSLVGSLVGFLFGAKGRKASIEEKSSSAAAQISEAYDRLNDALIERVNQMEKSVEKLEHKVAVLEIEKEVLIRENVKLRERIKVLEEDYTVEGWNDL